jgi:hypothetical protein
MLSADFVEENRLRRNPAFAGGASASEPSSSSLSPDIQNDHVARLPVEVRREAAARVTSSYLAKMTNSICLRDQRRAMSETGSVRPN